MPDYIRSVVKCGRLTQLVSKPNTVSYVQLEAPLHLMQKGARDARGLRPSATCAFKPLDNLVLPKDACSSFGNVLFDIGEMPLYGGRVHDNTYNRPRLMNSCAPRSARPSLVNHLTDTSPSRNMFVACASL